jgi:glutamyl-tRNA synthetase
VNPSISPVRVRFAPSPTGPLHIGGVRTALYNYLLARQTGGKMLLRIEDTDQARFVPGAEQYIIEALNWVGIKIDEGQGVGGPHAPYKQSERTDIYQQYAQQLIAQDKAYYAFDSAEDLDQMRKTLEQQGLSFQYNGITRLKLSNSITLSAAEVQAKIAAGEPYVIRLKVPPKEEIRLNDLIRGWVVVHSSQIDDKVLMKSDGLPTYHLANVIDDHLMEISHVIRGEEWLPSAPLHVLLYRFLGWENTMPRFAHLPLLLKPEGNGKLSKRDADLGGFPVFPLQWTDPTTGQVARGFREDGYLSDAMTNFLAFLGWNPGTEQEMFSMEGLIEAFSIEKIGKAGAKFDIKKAQWFNQQYLKLQDNAFLANQLLDKFPENIGLEKAQTIVHLLKDRVTFPQEIISESAFLFEAPQSYDQTIVSTKWNADVNKVIAALVEALPNIDRFEGEHIKQSIHQITEDLGIKMGKIMQPLRVALTGVGAGPDLMLSMEIMGQIESIERLKKALEMIG